MTTVAESLDRRLMLAFEESSLPEEVGQIIANHVVSGVTPRLYWRGHGLTR